jgi:hypothetical protein
VSTPPNELPQPPAATPPTHVAGQQTAPSTTVPVATSAAIAANVPNNTMAVVSLVTGLGSFIAHLIPFVGGLTLAVVAIITGHIALGQIKRTGEPGRGFAIAGLVIGYIHIGLLALVLIFFFGFFLAIVGGIFAAASAQ